MDTDLNLDSDLRHFLQQIQRIDFWTVDFQVSPPILLVTSVLSASLLLKHVTKLPIPGLSAKSTEADTFDTFPDSLLSVVMPALSPSSPPTGSLT